MDLEQIEKLNELKQKGLISDEEYQQAKARILGGNVDVAQTPTIVRANNHDYSLALHLSQFCAWLVPFMGIIVPLIMWQVKKDDPYVNEQGKVVMNWVFSSLIYCVISVVLCFVLIGFALLAILFVGSIVFTIMGAMNANTGIIKNYPFTIKFFSVKETVPPVSSPHA